MSRPFQIDTDLGLREHFCRMVASGASYASLAEEFKITYNTIYYWKKRLGLPIDRNAGHRSDKYYTVYLRRDDSIVCHGTARECAAVMGMKLTTFYPTVYHTLKGKNRKYEIVVDTQSDDEEGDYED